MGKLLFVASGRTYAVLFFAGAAACVSIAAWMAFYETVPGPSPQPWRYGPLVGLALLAAALALARPATRLWNQKTELYERGFVHVARGTTVRARYGELRSIARAEFVHGPSQTCTTTLLLQPRTGDVVRVVNQSQAAKPDERFEGAWRAASGGLASAWEQQLRVRRTIDWLLDGAERPLVQISRTGIEARARAEDVFQPVALADLAYELADEKLTLQKAGGVLVQVAEAAPNVYPGLELLARLDARGAGSRFSPRR